MSCLGCVATLSGFGTEVVDIKEPQLSDEAKNEIKTSAKILFGAPAIGSVVGATGGALAWKAHRVWGGVIGFLGGGLVGGVVGGMIAKDRIEKKILPEVEKFAEEVGESIEKSMEKGSAPVNEQLEISSKVIEAVLQTATGSSAPSVVTKVMGTAIGTVQKTSIISKARIGAQRALKPAVQLAPQTQVQLPPLSVTPTAPRLSVVRPISVTPSTRPMYMSPIPRLPTPLPLVRPPVTVAASPISVTPTVSRTSVMPLSMVYAPTTTSTLAFRQASAPAPVDPSRMITSLPVGTSMTARLAY